MIQELSNDNFRSTVSNPSRSVLVEYYNPKCGACRPANLMFHVSAEAFKHHRDSLTFCAMDISRNACPSGIYVPGTPYIQLYVRGDTRRKTYLGELDAVSFNRFIQSELGLEAATSVNAASGGGLSSKPE